MKTIKRSYISAFFFLFIFPALLFSQEVSDAFDAPIFQKLTNDEGLSQGTINAIAQDQKGFIWIGTNDGLNRFDGYDVKVFRNIPGDSTTISTNLINAITFDSTGIMWIGTDKGLNRLDLKVGKFSMIEIGILNSATKITDLAITQNDLWIGTKTKGLLRLNVLSGEIEIYKNIPGHQQSIPENPISKLFVDSSRKLWAGFNDGKICYFVPQMNNFVCINHERFDGVSRQFKFITDIEEDSKHNLWISTYGMSLLYLNTTTLELQQVNPGSPENQQIPYVLPTILQATDSTLWIGCDLDGLLQYNIHTGKISQFNEGPQKQNLLYKTVKTLFMDKDGNLWIGTNGKGVNILSANASNFKNITPTSSDDISLQFSSVRSILETRDNILWIGGYTGLQKINLTTHQTEKYYFIIAYSLCEDPSDPNVLWIGTEGNGLFKLNKSTDEFTQIPEWRFLKRTDNNNPVEGGMYIFEIVPKDEHHLYVGTDLGLCIFNTSDESCHLFMNVPGDTNSIIDGNITNIYPDSKKQIWVSSSIGGLAKFNHESNTFSRLLSGSLDTPQSINRINCIFEDSQRRFWLGTSTGLFNIDTETGAKKEYREKDGLPNDMVYGILEDQKTNLWLSTNLGIAQFIPETETFISFNKNDGLPSNEFNNAAYFQSSKSKLYFGGVNGITMFNPGKIRQSPIHAKIVVSDLKIIGNKTVSDFTFSYKSEIVLQPDQKNLNLKFSSLQYYTPGSSKYAFKLPKTTYNWIEMDEGRNLTLTALKPGKHIIEINAAYNNEAWDENPTQLTIIVLPRFYETLWFKVLIGLLVFSGIAMFYLIRINLIKKQRRKLEELVSSRTEELKLANEAKDKFFSIIAHDLKSPFNSMLGFSDILISEWKDIEDAEKYDFIKQIKTTAEDTFQLLINLLEWSRIQKEQITFSPTDINLGELAHVCYNQLKASSYLKNIRINLEISENIIVSADANMLHAVFRNLLSNAIKFTPKNGTISVTIKPEGNFIKCCVIDTGVGMTKEAAENLFKLQYRNSTKGTDGESGTGLGLVLCSEFIKKHNGKFSVESEPGKGSCFCFTIPSLKR